MNSLLNNNDKSNILDGILHWIDNNMSNFYTPNELEIKSNPEEISPDITRKAFTELGLALRFAQRSKKVNTHPVFENIKEKWLNNLIKNSFFFDIKKRIKLFPHRVLAYATLNSFGIGANHIKYDLETVMNRGYMDRVERSPWEKLDMKYYTEMARLSNNFPKYEALLRDCMLQNLPSLSYVKKFDLYGLTHLLFHFSDFSTNNMRHFLGDQFNAIQEYIDSTLCICLIDQDWDLVLELLINQFCMGKKFTALDIASALAIKKVQQPSGFIPGRDWIKNFQEKTDFNKKEHSFQDVYHPTILGLFLLTLEFKD